MNLEKPSVIFMGTASFGIPTLEIINENYKLKAIVTNYDKPSGRGLKIKNSPVKNYALDNNITFYQPKNLKNPDFTNSIYKLKPDFIIVVAFRMIPKSIWTIPKFGTINLHASLLPNYRGSAPINWVIINNEKITGVTSFYIDENIDTGDILLQKEIQIDNQINAGELHDKLQILAGDVVKKTIDGILENKIKSVKQNDISDLKTAFKFDKENTLINWDKNTIEIYNFIRGLNPFPGARTLLNIAGKVINKKNITIYDSDYLIQPNNENNGSITTTNCSLKITCEDGYIFVKEVKVEGKKKMKIKDLLNGFKIPKNSYVK